MFEWRNSDYSWLICRYGAGQIFTHEPNYRRNPLFAYAACGELTTHPGEILYYPAEWWHNTLSIDDLTISVATRYVDTKHYTSVWRDLMYRCANPSEDIRLKWPGAAPPVTSAVCGALDGCLKLWKRDLQEMYPDL